MATPAFLERMNAIFAAERSNQFLLTGNTDDLVDASSLDNGAAWLSLDEFLVRRLAARGHRVVRFDLAAGVRFACDEDRRHCLDRLGRGGGRMLAAAERDALAALAFCAAITRSPGRDAVSVVIADAELLVPEAAASQLSDIDRRRLALMREWLRDPRFLAHNGALILMTRSAAGVSARLRELPHLMTVDVPLPDASSRQRFMRDERRREGGELAIGEDELVRCTAGMTLHDLRALMREAAWSGTPLGHAELLAEVNRLLAARIGDHIELIQPAHDLDQVIGHRALKEELARQRLLLDGGDPALAPVGILISGPNGTGKTWIASAWAASCRRLVVSLKNLRGSWFGETDRIFEQVRQVLEALGNVIVLIDEADAMFAPPGDQVHETEARLFGSLIRMMGDPANRGRLVWLLVTARPERLASDLKRSGRAGLHLPVFDPEGADAEAFLVTLCQAAGIDEDATVMAALRQHMCGCSPADYHELAVALRAERLLRGSLDPAAIEAVLGDHLPLELGNRRYQSLQAALHCSRRSLLPESLRRCDRDAIRARLAREEMAVHDESPST